MSCLTGKCQIVVITFSANKSTHTTHFKFTQFLKETFKFPNKFLHNYFLVTFHRELQLVKIAESKCVGLKKREIIRGHVKLKITNTTGMLHKALFSSRIE